MREPLAIVSLFSGIGGLELGLERADVGHVVAQVEQDAYCRAVLAKHWPDVVRFNDVRTVGAHNLPACDVICGGFPCQDISLAGKGAGLDGARSGLWFEYLRIVREVRPRAVVIENVAALRRRGLDTVLSGLLAAGYDPRWDFASASDVGAPHRRKRLFIVAVADASGVRERESATADAFAARGRARHVAGGSGEPVADASSGARLGTPSRAGGHAALGGEGESGDVADARDHRREGRAQPDLGPVESGQQAPLRHDAHGRDAALADADGERGRGGPTGREHAADAREPSRRTARAEPRAPEPGMGRGPHGLRTWLDRVAAGCPRFPRPPGPAQDEWEPARTAADVVARAPRLKALGNAVVPQVAEAVGLWLLDVMQGERPRAATRAA